MAEESTLFSTIRIPQLHNEVQAQIRTLIDNQVLKPGQALPSERELARQLGVSRNSLREALRVLEARGIVVTRHGVGRTVREASTEGADSERLTSILETATIVEVLEVREALEIKGVHLACERATEEDLHAIEAASDGESWDDTIRFHQLVASASHNYVLEQIISQQMSLLGALRQRDRYPSESDAGGLIVKHGQIAAALRARDAPQAVELMREHLHESRDRVEGH